MNGSELSERNRLVTAAPGRPGQTRPDRSEETRRNGFDLVLSERSIGGRQNADELLVFLLIGITR